MTISQDPSQKGVAANRSVSRAVQVLRALAASETPMTVTDIARTIDLPRATTFRLLMTLEEEGIVDRQDTLYWLGWDLARLAQSVDPATGLVPRIKDELDTFAEEIGETVTFSLRRGRYDLDLVLQSSPRLLGMTMSEMYGMRWPLHASATGKLLLAELSPEQVRAATGETLAALTEHTITTYEALGRELDTVRRQGWASTLQELEDGIIALAAPVRDSAGALIGAVSVVGPLHRLADQQKQEQLKNCLIDAAERVRRRLNTTGVQ